MAKGKRLSEETKMSIAEKAWSGEDPKKLAGTFGIAPSTVLDYKNKYPKKRTVKQKVSVPSTPKGNTRVSDERMRELEIERDIWKAAYIAAVKNRE